MTATGRRIEELEARREELTAELEEVRDSAREAAVGTSKVSTMAKGQAAAAALERAVEDVDQALVELRGQEAQEEEAAAEMEALFGAAC